VGDKLSERGVRLLCWTNKMHISSRKRDVNLCLVLKNATPLACKKKYWQHLLKSKFVRSSRWCRVKRKILPTLRSTFPFLNWYPSIHATPLPTYRDLLFVNLFFVNNIVQMFAQTLAGFLSFFPPMSTWFREKKNNGERVQIYHFQVKKYSGSDSCKFEENIF
jgi:hypothetical protein